MSDDLCVYTALLGGYERLNAQPNARSSNSRWLCFTDDSSLTSDDWEIVVVEPSFPFDSIRSARQLKMLGHPALRPYETTLWIDNAVVLDAPPESLVSWWLRDADLAFPQHSYRATVLDEFQAVLDDVLDEPARITEQLDHYARTSPAVLDQTPLWTAIIARRCTAPVELFMTTWWEQTLRYSRRDQLSVNYALQHSGVDVTIMDVDNFESEWHRWPITTGRTRSKRNWDIANQARLPMADLVLTKRQLAETTARAEELEADAAESNSERDELVRVLAVQERQLVDLERVQRDADSLAQQLANAEASAGASAGQLRQQSDRSAELSALLDASESTVRELQQALDESRSHVAAILSSRTWRVSQAMLRLLGPLRRPAARLVRSPAPNR